MKAYVSDFNNVLMGVRDRVDIAIDPRDADVLILWQDVRGGMRTLCELNRDFMGKPVVVVQHGRGASRDYCAPNNFPMFADKWCAWGEVEAERIRAAGYGDRVVVTGSPLAPRIREIERESDKEFIAAFSPIIASHEEPYNLKVFWELKKIELEYAQKNMEKHWEKLRTGWHSWLVDVDEVTENKVHWDLLRRNFFLISKITDIHDQALYHGVVVRTRQNNVSHVENTMAMLSKTDFVIGLEEGTLHLMANALDIPTMVIRGFDYGKFGGVDNYKPELINSDATDFCEFDGIRETIARILEDVSSKKDARARVVREEFDPFPDQDPVENIIDVASELAGGDIRVRKEVNHGVSQHCG